MKTNDTVTTSLVTITPQMATELLGANTRNRPLSAATVDKLASLMKDGRWEFNGDTITFSRTGVLIDGQHRLAAIAQSGFSVKALIVRGVEDRVFATKDLGKKRRGADILAILGAPNASTLAATLTLLDAYYNNKITWTNYRVQPDYEALLLQYPDAQARVDEVRKACRFGFWSHMAAAYAICAEVDAESAEDFFGALFAGTNLRRGSPEHVLREQINYSSKLSRNQGLKVMAWTIKAWNAMRSGRTLKIITWKCGPDMREDFPTAV